MRAPSLTVVVAAAVIGAPAIAADPVYRSVMPDGRVLYGEAPEAGAKQTRKITPPRASTGTILVSPEEKRKAEGVKPEPGGTVVLPRASRPTQVPLESGVLQAPNSLPERRY
jgi:hypothetical protein